MNCSESKVHDILQKAFPLLPPIMKMFLLGYLEGLAEMAKRQNESPYISQRPALLYHSREAGGNRKSWEFVIFSIVANCNIKLSISSVRISQVTARCGLGEEGAVGDRRGQAGRAGQAA